jgi:hypothetical protein
VFEFKQANEDELRKLFSRAGFVWNITIPQGSDGRYCRVQGPLFLKICSQGNPLWDPPLFTGISGWRAVQLPATVVAGNSEGLYWI